MANRRQLVRSLLFVTTLSLSLGAIAQNPKVTDLPAKVKFTTWRTVIQAEGFTEYAGTFDSPYLSHQVNNDRVPIRVFVPEEQDSKVPFVVILHYLGAQDLKVERSLALELVRKGIGAVLIELPYHMDRTPPDARSGELALAPDTAKLIAMMTQSVLDVRRTIDLVSERPEFDSKRVGLAGISLGALVSSLVFAIDERVGYSAFLLGGVDFAHIIWTSSLVSSARENLRRRGYSEGRLRSELAEVEPLGFLPGKLGRSSFVIGGKFDTVVPTRTTQSLINALDHPKTLSIDTGHYGGIFVQKRLLQEVSTYFEKEMHSGTYSPPKRLLAPTIRVGALYTGRNGFDLGVGIDLFKSNARADFILTGMFTPRGPVAFGGGRLGSGFYLGVSVGTRRVSPALMWSTVL